MTIHYKSKQSMVDYINAANKTRLTVAELDFGLPQAIAGTWREGLIDANTAIKLTAREESNFSGYRVICYDRLNLSDLNNLVGGMSVKCYKPTTNFDLIPPIFRRYGIPLDPDDFIEEPFEHDGLNPTPCRFKAKPDTVGWIGEIEIMSQEGHAVLSRHLTEPLLPGMNYPIEGNGLGGNAMSYFYGDDFTKYKSTLEDIESGTFIDETHLEFLEAIKGTDKDNGRSLWNLDPLKTTWSLHGAEIIYSGINSPLLPTNQSYKYVLGMLIRPDVTTPPGICYLHYDDPYDPNEV